MTVRSATAVHALIKARPGGGGGASRPGAATAVGKANAARIVSRASDAAAAAAGGGRGGMGGAGGGALSALEDLVLVGNDELPEEVLDAVAAWKTRQWAKLTSLMG